MREGEEFATLKKIYLEINELECYLQALAWHSDKRRKDVYYNRALL
jgi:hypothetical protein